MSGFPGGRVSEFQGFRVSGFQGSRVWRQCIGRRKDIRFRHECLKAAQTSREPHRSPGGRREGGKGRSQLLPRSQHSVLIMSPNPCDLPAHHTTTGLQKEPLPPGGLQHTTLHLEVKRQGAPLRPPKQPNTQEPQGGGPRSLSRSWWDGSSSSPSPFPSSSDPGGAAPTPPCLSRATTPSSKPTKTH